MIRNAIEQDVPFGIVLSKGEGVHSKGVKVGVKEVFKKHSNGEYDILVKGQEIFKVMNTELEGETIVGQVEYLPVQTSLEGDYFKSFQDSYLKILLKFGVDKDLEIHMRKKISYEFLQGLQLPLVLKKELLEIDDEISRLEFIENIFNNVLDTDTAPSNGNMPQA